MSSIHDTGLPTTARDGRVASSALSRITAPPRKKHAVLWTLLTAISVAVAATTWATGGAGSVIVSVVAVIAGAFAVRTTRYNLNEYPKLRQLWQKSCMCARCGDIFAA